MWLERGRLTLKNRYFSSIKFSGDGSSDSQMDPLIESLSKRLKHEGMVA